MSNVKSLLLFYQRLLPLVKPYRMRLAGALAFSLLFAATNGAFLFVVKEVWASMIERTGGPLNWFELLAVAMLVPAVMLALGIFDFLSNYLINWVGLHAVTDLRVKVFAHLQTLSVDFYSDSRSGDLISRVTNDVGLIQRALSTFIEDLVKQPFTLVFIIAIMLYKDWRLTLAAVVLFPVCVAPIITFGRKTRSASRAAQQHQGSLVSVSARGNCWIARRQGVQRRAARDGGFSRAEPEGVRPTDAGRARDGVVAADNRGIGGGGLGFGVHLCLPTGHARQRPSHHGLRPVPTVRSR